MSAEIPYFACVGAVNTGKTSTIATLIEDDRLRISDRPGETTQCQRFVVELSGQPLVGFFDTPGFQNAKGALSILRELENPVGDPLDAFRAFLDRHGSDEEYSEECKLFRPLVDGAGILYIVDASEPFREVNDAEMKILLMTGRPRVGLINTTSTPTHQAVWESRLGQHFNLVRHFNAHHADFFDRMDLLKTLMGIDARWRDALEQAVATYEADWTARREECADIVTELLTRTLSHRETVSVGPGTDVRVKSRELAQRFEESLRSMERDAHLRIIRVFRHHRLGVDASAGALRSMDLFGEDVWRLCGLDEKQLVVAGTVAGAAVGLVLDTGLAFHTFGGGTIFGGLLGGGGALIAGKSRPEIEVRLPGRLGDLLGRQKLAGRDLRVGPMKELNFPWILLDRAFAVFYYSARRSHARRGEQEFSLPDQIEALRGRRLLTQEWPEDVRKECERIFALTRKGRCGIAEAQSLRDILTARLEQVARDREH